MRVQTATFAASAFSGFALLASLLVMGHIYMNVQELWADLDGEMSQFKSSTDDIWRDMISMGSIRSRREAYGGDGGYKATGEPNEEAKFPGPPGEGPTDGGAPPGTSLSSACQCNAKNSCPRGPAGPKGTPGAPGPNGFPGVDGINGVDADDNQLDERQMDRCFYCPPGAPGGPGPSGRPGPRGMPGQAGNRGSDGRDGNPGIPGPIGAPGAQGRQGPEGRSGEKGNDGRKPIGRPGPKGQRGPPGPVGPEGAAGKDGPEGEAGPAGTDGPEGPQGEKGPDGAPGPEGHDGRTGQDGGYCHCPERGGASAGVSNDGAKGSYRRN